MRRGLKIGLILIAIFGCKKNIPDVASLIISINVSKDTVMADGFTKITVTAVLNREAETDKRTIVFKTSVGNFTNGTNGTISVKAEFDHDTLRASAILTAPMRPGFILLSASPDVIERENYTIYDSVIAILSEPKRIVLNPSSFGLRNNFQGEDTLSATLLNDAGNNVSSGVPVLFEDYFVNGDSAKGHYRNSRLVSDGSSSVTTTYSVGQISIGAVIYLKVTVLNSNGEKSNIKDSIPITIIQ